MLKKLLIDKLSSIYGLDSEEVSLETPIHLDHGDFASIVPLKFWKDKGFQSPMHMAEDIKEIVSKGDEIQKNVSKIEAVKPGFVNFWIADNKLFENLNRITRQGENYGRQEKNKGKAIVEYSSPNIAKPFTVGHLRSTVIGDAIANLMEFGGWEVLRDNHIGDWGTQFGKQIYAIKKWGDEALIEKSESPVKELVSLYVKFHKEAENDPIHEEGAREWFKKLEEGDDEARRIWRKCIEWSWSEFETIYNKLGVSFSGVFNDGRGLGESSFEEIIPEVISLLDKKGVLKEGEQGARLVFFENDKLPPAMIVKKDGTSLYHTRDLAADKYRLENYNPDLIVNEVGAEQTLYFKQLFEIENMLGWFEEGQRVHVSHGLIRFADQKMSTRKGNVIWLQDILEEAEKRAKTLGSETDQLAQEVAVGAIKWNDLKRDPKTEIVFDWDEILNMEGNSGPYMQYTHARAISVMQKKNLDKLSNFESLQSATGDLNEDERTVARLLTRFEDNVALATNSYKPNLLANYLYDVAQAYNVFYNKHKILGSENEDLRILLTAATSIVLQNGLKLLGISTPSKM